MTTENTNRVKCQLFFNKVNGKFLHAATFVPLDQIGGQEYVNIVEADFDMINDKVVGLYPDFKVQDRSEGPEEYYEAYADTAMATKITKRYPVVEQVNVLGRALMILAKHHGEELEELQEMLEYIKLCKDTNRTTKEFYRDSPDYIYVSNDEAAEEHASRFEGGIHEFLGPRELSGGRVFG